MQFQIINNDLFGQGQVIDNVREFMQQTKPEIDDSVIAQGETNNRCPISGINIAAPSGI